MNFRGYKDMGDLKDREPTYIVGQGRGSDLWTGDCTVSKTLCSLKHTETEKGVSITLLEVMGKKAMFKLIARSTRRILLSLSNIVKAHSGSIKGLHLEVRSRDPPTVRVASTLAFLSNLQKDLSLLSPLYQNGKDVKQGSKVLTLPPVSGVREKYLDTDMKDASDYNDVPGALMDEKNDMISPNVENGNLSLDNIALDSVDAEIGKVQPILRMLAGSSASAFDLSGSISKIFEKQRNF
ncbi:hypothetical protein P3S68_007854 [Capsicum galapagoense]